MSRHVIDLVRETNEPAQNIVVLVVRTGFFSGKHGVEDIVGRRDPVQICSN